MAESIKALTLGQCNPCGPGFDPRPRVEADGMDKVFVSCHIQVTCLANVYPSLLCVFPENIKFVKRGIYMILIVWFVIKAQGQKGN